MNIDWTLLEVKKKWCFFWQVEKAEAILIQMKESQADKEKMATLFDEFYKALPHNKKFRKTEFSTYWLARKQDVCQV